MICPCCRCVNCPAFARFRAIIDEEVYRTKLGEDLVCAWCARRRDEPHRDPCHGAELLRKAGL